jgi:hypothetical protein
MWPVSGPEDPYTGCCISSHLDLYQVKWNVGYGPAFGCVDVSVIGLEGGKQGRTRTCQEHSYTSYSETEVCHYIMAEFLHFQGEPNSSPHFIDLQVALELS